MLVCCSEIENKMMPADDAVSPMQGDRYPTGYIRRTDAAASGHDLAAEKLLHPDAMGVLVPGRDKHFYSSGAFNLIQLIFYILRQTGPAHLLLTTYSISMDSIAAIHRKVETGELLVRVSGSISFTSQTVGLFCRLIVTRKVYNVNHRRGGPRSADS